MSDSDHIDDILRSWPCDTDSISVRLVEGKDGREVLQMRIDMGILQLETTGRPDGDRPGGEDTYYDFLQAESIREGADDFVMNEEQCRGADREFLQYYHRRSCWLSMREHGSAVKDADHTLALMDFCELHSPNEHWTISHEQYRPIVIFDRTQASALNKLEEDGPEAAVQEISIGLESIRELFTQHDARTACGCYRSRTV